MKADIVTGNHNQTVSKGLRACIRREYSVFIAQLPWTTPLEDANYAFRSAARYSNPS